jgi:hypothetical protein
MTRFSRKFHTLQIYTNPQEEKGVTIGLQGVYVKMVVKEFF